MKDLEKQIEVAAEIYAYDISVDFASVSRINSFIEGAKSESAKQYWQDGMYTEEEVFRLVLQAETLGHANGFRNEEIDITEWFEENKKK